MRNETVFELSPLVEAEAHLKKREAKEPAYAEAEIIEPVAAKPRMELVPVVTVEESTPEVGNEILHQYATVFVVMSGSAVLAYFIYEGALAAAPVVREMAAEMAMVVMIVVKYVAGALASIVGFLVVVKLLWMWANALFAKPVDTDFPTLVRKETLPGNETAKKSRKFVQTFEEIIEE